MRFIWHGLTAVILTHITGCGLMHKTTRSYNPVILSLDGTRTFKSCKEVQSYAEAARQRLMIPRVMAEQAMPSSAPGDSINVDGQTNLQESGVDESDVVKITEDAIFVLRESDVVVLDRLTKKERGTINFDSLGGAELYVSENKLIIIAPHRLSASVDVQFYDLKTGVMPLLASKVSLVGALTESRIKDGQLIAILSSSIPYNDLLGHLRLSGVSCEQTVVPNLTEISDTDLLPMRFSTIHSLDVQSNGAMRHSLGILDDVDHMYMSSGHVFTASYNGRWYQPPSTFIRQIDLDATTGDVALVANGVVDGHVKDKWAFKYFDDRQALAIATSGFKITTEGYLETNYLHTLQREDHDLKVRGRLEDFGQNEDIRAVRYLGNIAYVVTFKKTDPLFAIDLSDINTPRLLGELEIPGFSTMLHPLGGGQMLGVGFDAQDMGSFAWFQGIQVSLFDVSKPELPQRLDVKINGARGSSSEATFDHHALFYDSESKIVGLPMNVFGDASIHNERAYGEFKSSGAVFYKISDGHLNDLIRVSHADMMSNECHKALKNPSFWWANQQNSIDIRRIFSLDGSIFTVSPFGIKVYDRNLINMTQQVIFSGVGARCKEAPQRFD